MAFSKIHDWNDTGVLATLTSGNVEPFALSDGGTLTISVGGNPAESVIFDAADFGNIAAATAAEVVASIDAQTDARLTAAAVGGAVQVGDAYDWGTDASVEVTGGTNAASFNFPGGAATGTGDGAPRAESMRCVGQQQVRILNTANSDEWFGFESALGQLTICSLVKAGPATAAQQAAEQVEVQSGVARQQNQQAAINDLRTKRENGTPLVAADFDAMADLLVNHF